MALPPGQMLSFPMRKFSFYALASLGLCASLHAFENPRVDVKIANRQNNETDYTYQVPGHASSQTNDSASCYSSGNSAHCSGSGITNTTVTAPHDVLMHLTGATFTLLLQDGRMAVVNCESKFQERFAGRAGNRRSCRIPLMDDVQAEFKGNSAKLFWVVSLDGKKTESETYKILAVIPKLQSQP
ncbi:hypothetical protein BDD14_2621 [Edaphobacter modestus]|uniref:Uncharacterized protein n=1 Tax=Edaphobacter modestus TaxID=388466 RepID=A0A4Q7YVM8_9BACT|nr:hypothetical protein BDD14_2621 [Edaphobacter modestus]